jgi:site-specific DNA-cytosine methylase
VVLAVAAVGYHRAGFDVVGVDNRPQPNYPFEFHQADAMTFPLDGYDAIHASPPCQAYTVLRTHRKQAHLHPDWSRRFALGWSQAAFRTSSRTSSGRR